MQSSPEFSFTYQVLITGHYVFISGTKPLNPEAAVIHSILDSYNINVRPVLNRSQSITVRLDVVFRQLVLLVRSKLALLLSTSALL